MLKENCSKKHIAEENEEETTGVVSIAENTIKKMIQEEIHNLVEEDQRKQTGMIVKKLVSEIGKFFTVGAWGRLPPEKLMGVVTHLTAIKDAIGEQ